MDDAHLIPILLLLAAANWANGLVFTAYPTPHASPCNVTNNDTCHDLKSVWEEAENGDTIMVDSESETGSRGPFLNCSDTALVAKAIRLVGKDTRAEFGCNTPPHDTSRSSLVLSAPTDDPSSEGCVTFENIAFSHTDITVVQISVIFSNVVLKNSTVTVISNGTSVHTATIDAIEMQGFAKCGFKEDCDPYAQFKIYGSYAQISVSESKFLQSLVEIGSTTDTYISVTNCSFDNDIEDDRAVMGGLRVGFWPISTNSTVHVEGTQFRNQFNWSPVDAVMNIFEASMRVYLYRMHGNPRELAKLNPNLRYNISVEVAHCTFINNERGLTVQGEIEYVTVEHTRFINNVAMHAGAGILLLTPEIIIRNCTFDSNSAGNIRHYDVLPSDGLVVLSGDVARVHSKCCKGSVTLLGKGGAIRVQKGKAIIYNTVFTNNTARISGGTIFVDKGARVEIFNCYFRNIMSRMMASQQGEVVYSNGHVIVDGATLDIAAATSHVSLFQHSGDRWSIEVYDITVHCPMGFNMRVTNTTSYMVVDRKGLKRSYKLDQLAHFCESCPRYKYSIDHGQMSYSLDQGVLDYFALMINEEYPEDSKHERYYKHDITCKTCPYGGCCETGVTALPDFWGYQQEKDTLIFQVCPKGYCCANTKSCRSYDTCAAHRTDRLCGICETGYTEALFSAKCVPSEECGPIWLWPFALSTGVIYMLFLLYQKDIRGFVFSGDINTMLARLRWWDRKSKTADICDNENTIRLTAQENGASEQDSFGTIKTPFERNGELHENNTVIARSKGSVKSNGSSEIKYNIVGQEAKPDEMEENAEEEGTKAASQTDVGAILLIMVLYYFQDAMLFNVPSVTDRPESKRWRQIKKVLLGMFKFRLEVVHFVDNVCLIPEMTASEKLLAKTLIVPFIIVLFVVLFAMYYCVQCVKKHGSKSKDKDKDKGKEEDDEEDKDPGTTFLTRLSSGIMLTLLFMYQLLASTAFTLLNCVQVGSDKVLFIEGTITCYQHWQYGVMGYASCCIIPFCFALMIGPGMLKEKRISSLTFFVACVCPLPFVICWTLFRVYQRVTGRRTANPVNEADVEVTASEETILKMMCGPFREISNKITGPICWSGILVFRRLVLVLFYTFINNSLLRIISMLSFCFIVLLVHVSVKPYKEQCVNLAGSVSISALMLIGGINLIRASFEVAEYVPRGPNEMLIYCMKQFENVLMLWIPLCTVCMIFVIFVIKVILIVARKCEKACSN